MTPRQKKFIDLYLKDPNGTRAAIKAGYSPKGAAAEASRMLRNPKVSAELEKRLQKISAKHEITAERIIAELGKIAFSNMRKYAKWGNNGIELTDSESLSDDDAACVSELSQTRGKTSSIRFKLHSKDRALELLGKRFGLFDAEPEDPTKDKEPPPQSFFEHSAKLNGVGH